MVAFANIHNDGWYIDPRMILAGEVFCWVDGCTRKLSYTHRRSVYCYRHRMNLIERGDPHAHPPELPRRRDDVIAAVVKAIEYYGITAGPRGMAYAAEAVGYDKPESLERLLQRAGRNDLVRRLCGASGTHVTTLHAARR